MGFPATGTLSLRQIAAVSMGWATGWALAWGLAAFLFQNLGPYPQFFNDRPFDMPEYNVLFRDFRSYPKLFYDYGGYIGTP